MPRIKRIKPTDSLSVLKNLEERATNPKYPVCFPTYKNRKPSALDNLDPFNDTPIFVFIYDFDKENYEWLDRPNVTKVFVPKEYITIHRMRYFIENYMGKQKYWVCDDDIKHVLISPDKHIVPTGKAMNMMELYLEDHPELNYGAVSMSHVEISCKFFSDESDIISNGYTGSVTFYDGTKLIDNNVWYTQDTLCNEHLELTLNINYAGMKVGCAHWAYVVSNIPMASKKSLAYLYQSHVNMQLVNYIKHGDHVRLWASKSHVINTRINYTRLSKPKTWDETLLSLCKEGDVEKVIEYLNSKKNK